MAKPKNQCRNEKGDGTFRQRPNGTFEYNRVLILMQQYRILQKIKQNPILKRIIHTNKDIQEIYIQ